MNKKTALWIMGIGAALSLYDMMASDSPLYGAGKPLEKMRWKVYTSDGPPKKDWYLSITDAAAIVGAVLYFK